MTTAYTESIEVRSAAIAVMGKHKAKFSHLEANEMAFLMRSSKRTDDAFHPDRAGGAFLVPDRFRALVEVESGIWLARQWWDRFDASQREAWLYHLLRRIQDKPKGEGLTLVKPEVSAFADEALHYGAWSDDLSLWATNLDRRQNGEKEPAAAPKAGKKAKPAADVDDKPSDFPTVH